jgi:DNA-binding transcriptional ArsR family regulator
MTVIETFAALAEPSRFRIVELLRDGARPVGEIGQTLKMGQPQVSKHLRVLKDLGLVDVEPRAQQRLYQLRAAPLRELRGWLEDYRSLWDERFTGLQAVIETLKAREQEKRTRAGRRSGPKGKRP